MITWPTPVVFSWPRFVPSRSQRKRVAGRRRSTWTPWRSGWTVSTTSWTTSDRSAPSWSSKTPPCSSKSKSCRPSWQPRLPRWPSMRTPKAALLIRCAGHEIIIFNLRGPYYKTSWLCSLCSTEVAIALLTLQSRVRIMALPKFSNRWIFEHNDPIDRKHCWVSGWHYLEGKIFVHRWSRF